MSTVLDPPSATTPATDPDRVGLLAGLMAALGPDDAVSVGGVSWDEYERLLDARGEGRPGVRVTYHAGRLTVMTTGAPHERWKTLLLGLVDFYLAAARVPAIPCGNMTVRRRGAGGLEPDGCYYIRPPAALLTVRPLDFATDPPPDLAVEVEVSRAVVSRLPVLAALRVPEVWRFDGTAVTVLRLQPAGDYQPVPASLLLPGFPLAAVPRYLRLAETVFYPELMDRFQAEVRATLPPPETA